VPSLTTGKRTYVWRKCEAFANEEREVMGCGLVFQGKRQAVCFLILLLRMLYCGDNIWRAGLRRNFDVDIGRST
jgi:hypothetical protein